MPTQSSDVETQLRGTKQLFEGQEQITGDCESLRAMKHGTLRSIQTMVQQIQCLDTGAAARLQQSICDSGFTAEQKKIYDDLSESRARVDDR